MSTHSGEIQNTYVQLITAPSSGTNGTVKFHAQMTDASGGDFEEWGFFYKKSTTDVAVHTGNTIDDPGGVVADNPQTLPGGAPNWFTRDAVVNAGRGDKYYFNAYLHDTNHAGPPGAEYIFQNPADEETAPIGTSFIIPNVDQDAATINTPFQATLNGKLEEDLYSNAFPFVEAGFDYKRAGDDWSAAITVVAPPGAWLEGPATWTKTVQDLSNNQQYESRAWFKVKDRVATAPPPASDITIHLASPSEEETWTTLDHPVPVIKHNWFDPNDDGSGGPNNGPDEDKAKTQVQVVFFPDDVGLWTGWHGTEEEMTTASYASSRIAATPIEVHFRGELDVSGNPPTVANHLGFFVGVAAAPDHNTNILDIVDGSQNVPANVPANVPTAGIFYNKVLPEGESTNGPYSDFPIPGQQYYVNAYAKSDSSGGVFYYSEGAGADGGSDEAPDGVIFKTPHVWMNDASCATITSAGNSSGNAAVTFEAVIKARPRYPGNDLDYQHDKKGFFYWSKAGHAVTDAQAGVTANKLYPGKESNEQSDTAEGPTDPHKPDLGPVKVEQQWDQGAVDPLVDDGTGTYTKSPAANIKWGTDYWVRPFVQDNSKGGSPDSGTGLSTVFYATPDTGAPLAASRCAWQPAQKFYIPIVAATPVHVPFSQTPNSFWIEAATSNLTILSGQLYTKDPPIKRKGYRVWKNADTEPSDHGVGGYDSDDDDEHWPTLLIDNLEQNTEYKWRAIAEVYQYDLATAPTFTIEAVSGPDATQTTWTTIPLTVENHSTDAIRIGVYGAAPAVTADTCVGEITTTSAPFQHIAVKGTVVDAGGIEEVGYFLNNDTNPSWDENLIYVRADTLVDGDHLLDRQDVFLGGGPSPGTPLDLATDYWINFFASTVDHTPAALGSASDFVYDATSNPDGVKFQIPKVVNKTIIYVRGDNYASPLKIKLEGDVEGTIGDFQSDASGFGFVWIQDCLSCVPGDAVFPHLNTTSVEKFEEKDTQKTWLDLSNNTHFKHEITDITVSNWAKRYHVNAFVRDRFKGEQVGASVVANSGQGNEQGIVYYPLEAGGGHLEFVIPKPETLQPAEPSNEVTGYAITLSGRIPAANTDEYDNTKVKIEKHGFYIGKADDVGTDIDFSNPETGATKVEISGEPAQDGNFRTWTKRVGDVDPPGSTNDVPPIITGDTTYRIRSFVTIFKQGTTGTPAILLLGDLKTVITPPDYAEVVGNDPSGEFLPNNKFMLKAKLFRLGSNTGKAHTIGFFVSETNSSPDHNPANHDFDAIADSTTPVLGVFEFELDVTNDGTLTYERGKTYYFNPYVKDQNGNYRYIGGASVPNTTIIGTTFTYPKVTNGLAGGVAPAAVNLLSVEEVVGQGKFTIRFGGDIVTVAKIGNEIPSGVKRGFFISDTVTSPDANTPGKIDVNDDLSAVGNFFEDKSELNKKKDYYVNAYVKDNTSGTYHYAGGLTAGSGFNFKIPDVGVNNPITDISGDAVQLDASRTEMIGFSETARGLFLDYGTNEPTTQVTSVDKDVLNWCTNVVKPLDILDATLGGEATYKTNAFITIDGVDISGVARSFTTLKWPIIQYLDISRNVAVEESSGYLKMKANVSDLGSGNAAIHANGLSGSQIGFYVGTDPEPKSGDPQTVTDNVLINGTFSVYEAVPALPAALPRNTSQDSSKNDVFLKRGVTYYTNVAVSQDHDWIPDASNTQYYGFTPNSVSISDPSCTTFAREANGGVFPDGISFIIPKIINNDPEIIDSSTVKLNLQIDSSGHTVDISGTNRLGFFLNHSTETWADASCNEKAYQDAIGGEDLDPPTISTPASDIILEDEYILGSGGSSSHLLKNPHIFQNIVTFSSTTNRKIIINVSSWRVLITPDASGCCGTTPTHGVDERVEATGGAVDLVNPFEVEVRWDGGAWQPCAEVVSASGEVWNDASNGIWYAARIVGNSLWEIDAPSSLGVIDVKVEWEPTNSVFATFFDTINDPSNNEALGLSDNGDPWDQINNPPFRVTSAKVIVTTIENVPLVEVENGILETTKTLSVADSSVILSSITYSNEDTPNATWTGLDGHAELDQTPPNDGYSVKHTHSYADKIFATGTSVVFGSTPSTEPTGVNDLDASASIYVYYKNSDTAVAPVYDISKILIPEMDPWRPPSYPPSPPPLKTEGIYHLDASGLIAGQNYYYTGYTALLRDNHNGIDSNNDPLRGESVDGDDYWYPPEYISEDSTNIVKTFCIGDSSCNPIPSSKTENETTLIGKTLGESPYPYAEEYGFVYWFDGSNNYDNRESVGSTPLPNPSAWSPITLTGLKDSTRYYAVPYFKQGVSPGGNYIYGGFDRTTKENKPTVWYTDLALCDVDLNEIGGVEFGNDNGGSSTGEGTGGLTDDDSGSQTRYKLIGIDASLNTNPPNNFEEENAPDWPNDLSGTVVELGLCWKVTDEPTSDKATASDFRKNLIDGSYNGYKDFNQISGTEDVFRDASCNIYDASINDLLYNTMYSLRAYAKNEPVVDNNLVVGARQSGGGYAYSSTDEWFVTPLPKVIIEDPSASHIPLVNAVNPFASDAPNILTKIGISGEILDNPDEASGNIIEYGFLFKMFEPEEEGPTSISYVDFNNETCDISTNLLGGGQYGNIFYPDNLVDTSFNIADEELVPYKFFQSLSLYWYDNGNVEMVKDLSYNRQYYFGSYARNLSDYYLKKGLDESFINTEGITSYKKFNDASDVFITPWPAPYIKILNLDKPLSLTKLSQYTFVNVKLEIFNYDPTRWGGIAEFGVIWEKSHKLKDSGIDPDDFTTQYMDCSGDWVGADGSGGWYKRGCSGEPIGNDFVEAAGESRDPGGWEWADGSVTEPAGWVHDASFSSGGFPDGNENLSCHWPLAMEQFVKLGVYKLGLQGTLDSSLYPSALGEHKPSVLGGTGSAQDPSSIPFNTDESYWLRPYVITRNKGFWIPLDVNGNPYNDDYPANPHPDSSFNIFYGPPKNLTFDLDLVDVRTGHTLHDPINWFTEGYKGDGAEIWPSMLDPGIDSVDMSGNILANPIIGNPPRGRVIKYGFLWWDGGKTATDGIEALDWPGKRFGFGPKAAAEGGIPNLGFTLANTDWPPDGSNNYCVAMKESTQIGYGWNIEADGRTTHDLSGTSFDISANDPHNGAQNDGEFGAGYTEGGISVASKSGYYWNSYPGADDGGWYKLAFPRNNPPWPPGKWDDTTESWSSPLGPNGEAAVIHSQNVIFDVKGHTRYPGSSEPIETEDRRLFNSTVWYRAYAINRYFDPESGEDAQIGINYGSVGRLELKKSVSFGVDMVNPVLVSSNIGTRSILVRGTLLGNMDGQGNPIVENYGFCWRKLVENHPEDKDGNPIPNSEREPTWHYDAVSKTWVEEFKSYPPPTVIDSSMVALGIRAEDTSGAGFAWSDEGGIEQYPLNVNDPSNEQIVGFGPSGEFPGETENSNPLFSGFTQNPPTFKFGEREWSFHYKIGSDGEELEAENGIKDQRFVGFDASGGKLISNTYYLIRSWVKGPVDPGTQKQDDGESASGIKYGPIWFINNDNKQEHKKRGWLALTRPLEKCSLDDIIIKNLTYKSAILKSKLLTNPNPSKLKKYGFVYMLDDASKNGLPTLEDNLYVLLNLPTNLNDLAAPPPKAMEKKISILPNSYYTIRAFADNSFESYISYDASGNGEGSATSEGGIIYSNPYTLLSGFCPPPESKIISTTNASYVSVQLRGEILNNFNGLISEHGFIVGKETMPVINDGSSYKYDLGSKNNIGQFTHLGMGLKYNTTYFARSFAYHPAAREDLRLQYGSHVLTFQTLNPDPPEIISTERMQNGLSSISATFSSEIKDTSGIELLSSYGFCWTTRVVPLSGKAEYIGNNEPLDSELKIENAEHYSVYTNPPSSFPFYFKTILTNLQPSTTYFVRSYAKINPIGYGEVHQFTTFDEPCECIPPTAKPIGALHPNKSSKMLCAEAIKRHGSAIIGTRGVTPNLL